MSTTTKPATLQEYLSSVAQADPKTALEIAMLETERAKANAAKASEEYRAMAEVEFDDKGRIVKANMGGLYRLATIYARSKIVPEHYQGKIDDCFIGCQMAFRLRIDPLAYMQSSYIVYGRPGLEAKLGIALLNMSGKIKGRVKYRDEGSGQNRKVTAWAIDEESGEEVSASIDWATVKAEGWDTKKGSKWLTIPDQMFRYRSAIFLIRAYYPEVLMGIEFADEIEDTAANRDSGKAGTRTTLADLTNRLNGNGSSHSEPEDRDEDFDANGEHKDNRREPEPSGDAGQTSGQSSQSSGDAELADDAARQDRLDAIQTEIEACTKAADVGAIQAREYETGKWSEKEIAYIKTMADAQRGAIRGKGGSPKQKELVS